MRFLCLIKAVKLSGLRLIISGLFIFSGLYSNTSFAWPTGQVNTYITDSEDSRLPLPNELIVKIAAYLDKDSLREFSATSRSHNIIAKDIVAKTWENIPKYIRDESTFKECFDNRINAFQRRVVSLVGIGFMIATPTVGIATTAYLEQYLNQYVAKACGITASLPFGFAAVSLNEKAVSLNRRQKELTGERVTPWVVRDSGSSSNSAN